LKPDRTPPDASTLVPPCYATITRENNNKKGEKYDSNETRLGLVAYSIRFMSLASQQRKNTGTMKRGSSNSTRSSFAG
jgi:hypothetical protein